MRLSDGWRREGASRDKLGAHGRRATVGALAFTNAGMLSPTKLLNVPLGYVWLEPSPQAQFSHQCGAASICAMMAGGAAERLVFGDCLGIRTRTGGMRRR